MKFGKEFEKQKVPECIEAYVDYNGLKHILWKVRRTKQNNQLPSSSRAAKQRLPLQRAISGSNQQCKSKGDIEDQVIAVDNVQQENSVKLYKTKFLLSPEEGGENEFMFFKKLDDELNKVNTFYKDKVEEVTREATSLNKQMDALVAFRIKVTTNPNHDVSSSLRRLSEDISSSSFSRISSSSSPQTTELMAGALISEAQTQQSTDDEINESSFKEVENELEHQPASLEILDRVKIINSLDGPISTVKGVFMDVKEKDLKFNKEELKRIEERLKTVFVEFYQKLRLLKHYSFMNLSAFSKILKKYEKITTRKAARAYMRAVDNSYLGISDEVNSLLNNVEATFIQHFSNSSRKEGMKSLRPKQKKQKHQITFFLGFFSGLSIALLISAVLLIQAKKNYWIQKRETCIWTIFSHFTDIYFWRRYRINYPFIFGFQRETELGYQEVFRLCNGLAMLVLGTFLAHVHIMESKSQDQRTSVEFIPLGLVTVTSIIMCCPFNILYRSSRFFLIKSLLHCICAPFYKVTLPDDFLADQLTSQGQAVRCFEYYICYYALERFSETPKNCHSRHIYTAFYYILAVIPFWIRFLQCLRRLFDEKDSAHAYNALRYLLTTIAIIIRTASQLRKKIIWKVLAFLSTAIATLTNTYWDIVVDWGLLRWKEKNFLLRDKLLVPHKSLYFVAMVLDVILRLTWLQRVLMTSNLYSLRGNTILSIFAFLEILRRGIWSFFRLENEHLNNVGKYRAFKSVPLPFNYTDEARQDKDN
ncbi:hypothetical protein M9H77_09936 [Catharanthus roseus]|uniref:Uncharacterized protein n=1 Tax=Catharanthus roseus TaxID=4058 RepID=A0ACC0C2H2_CATRO|nr:hypothetical protein M9H77_09936 [Catharanthus roseus]